MQFNQSISKTATAAAAMLVALMAWQHIILPIILSHDFFLVKVIFNKIRASLLYKVYYLLHILRMFLAKQEIH